MSQKRIAKISISVLQDDVADAAPVVEAPVEELQLRRARLEGEETEGGAKDGPIVQADFSSGAKVECRPALRL